MAERRDTSLLDFAIAASAAVVPVLLLVLLLVDVVRPLDPATPTVHSGDRHVSVRQIAALKTFERAIVRRDQVIIGSPTAILLLDRIPQCRSAWDGRGGMLDWARAALASSGATPPSPAQRLAAHLSDLDEELLRFSTGANRRVSAPVGFDALRWFDAVNLALQLPIEAPDYPGRKFTVQCADIANAAAMMSRADGRMLNALSWRGTEVSRVVSRWRPEQFVEVSAREVARANPWRGLPGCIFMGNSAAPGEARVPTYFISDARAVEQSLCTRPELFLVAEHDGEAAPPIGIEGEAKPDLAADDPRWKVPPSLDTMLQS